MEYSDIKIQIEYDGADFHGWQRQPHLRTVQGEIESVLSSLSGEKISIEGSGRTDAGVHAIAQVASFKWNTKVSAPIHKLQWILNNRLPHDICIRSLEVVDKDFHARFSAVGKSYEYQLCASDEKQPLLYRQMYIVPENIDMSKMKAAAKLLEGMHDFKSFMASGSRVEDTVRTIYKIEFKVDDVDDTKKQIIKIRFTGSGFLYNMVRILTGLLVDVGLGKKKVDDVKKIISARDRTLVEHTAPAQGLYLMKVYYSKDELQQELMDVKR